jgi:hypothetical protein
VQLGSVEYRAFFRPVRMLHERNDGLPALLVAGLVRDRALLDDVQRVESSYVLLGLFLMAMAVISLPAAKLWLIGPHVRYRRLDVLLFEVAAIAGAVLSAVLVLSVAARESLQLQLDAQLGRVARSLSHALSTRVEGAARSLQKFDGAPEFAAPPPPADDGVQGSERDCEPRQLPVDRQPPGPWNVLFRIDGQGRQTAKYYRAERTPCVDVASRDYFQTVRNRNLRYLAEPSTPAGSTLRGAAEVVRSRTTGDVVMVIAIPERQHPGSTLALEVPLADLTRQLLPRGVQTAVIDARGRVMLHSDNATFQGQSFFEDLRAQKLPALRSALDSQLEGALDIEYLGAPSRLYMQPLQAGWTAVAIANQELLDLPTRFMVLLTFLSLAVIALAALPGALLLRLARRLGRSLGPARGGVSATRSLLPFLLRYTDDRPRRVALVGAGVLMLATLAFWGAYDRIAEEEVRASQHHLAQQRLRFPDCFDASRNCVQLSALESPLAAPLSTALKSGLEQPLAMASLIDQVYAWMIDAASPLASLESEAPGVLHRARLQSSALAWSWTREGGVLRLTSSPLGLQLASAVPSLFDALRLDPRCLLPLFLIGAALALASWAIHASFRRLYFARAVPVPGAWIDAAALRTGQARLVLVLHPQPELADELRRDLPELSPGAAASDAFALIVDAERYFSEPDKLAAMISAHRGKLIVLSAVDWARWLLPERRIPLDQAFRHFEVLRGPGVGRWPLRGSEARAFASALWVSCNQEERRLLAQLALDGYVAPHPDNDPMIAHLRARGILRRDRLTFAEPHFCTFVRHTVSADELRNSASAAQHDAWNAIRVPLSTAVALVLCFVSFMQPELAAVGLPISSILASAKPLLKLLGVTSAEGE